ncbi:MAG: hypothetical protein Q7K57_07330 [Burkholderiaceae bacterium]|nr:hypothetical protein [Burkholderiaceae bacterium]
MNNDEVFAEAWRLMHKDPDAARELLSALVKEGNADALSYVALSYTFGEKSRENAIIALQQMETARSLGSTNAFFYLDVIFRNGMDFFKEFPDLVRQFSGLPLEQEIDNPDIPRIPVIDLPFEKPPADSMRIADASGWYRFMVPKIEEMVSDISDPSQKLAMAWRIKREIRRAATAALYDPDLAEDFYRAFPFQTLERMLETCVDESTHEAPELIALRALVSITPKEQCACPGNVGGDVKYWVNGKAVYASGKTDLDV